MGIGRRIFWGALVAWAVALLLLVAASQVWAAIELAYFRASSTNSSVLLEWATIREVNLNGFEILCKRATEPDSAYHPIGSRIAQGGPESGASYNFNVTAGLTFGESYCFRLREVTSDNVPGEIFELCGYGPGLTPTPTLVGAGVLTFTTPLTTGVEFLPTPITVENVPGLEPAPTLIPTETPFGLPPEFPTLQPTITPSPDPNQPISPLAQPLSPLPQPGVVEPSFLDPNAASAGMSAGFDPQALPTLDPLLAAPTPTETPTVLPTPTETPTATPIAQSPQLPQAADPAAAVAALPPGTTGMAGTEGAQVEASPTPLYVVVTATPTPEGLAVIPPTFTPWPTTTPTPGFAFADVLAPNTQNLMVMLLCLIFFSASGLGALGLITSVLYMRSQARRERLPSPYDRRRF
jgi:hypothetical protein